MILLNPKYDIDVIKFEKDNLGRLIVLDTKMNGVNLVLMNLYAPNDISQQVQFKIQLRENIMTERYIAIKNKTSKLFNEKWKCLILKDFVPEILPAPTS